MLRLNRQLGIAVLLIEQNARQGLRVSHRGYVMELGRVTYRGTGSALLENPEVQRAFLGGSSDLGGSSSAIRG